MSKLITKILTIFFIFSITPALSQIDTIVISCEGTSKYERKNVKYGNKTIQEQFVEDLSISVINKKIRGVEILYTTHGLARSSTYITDDNLDIKGSGKILIFKNELRETDKDKEYKKLFRLSLVNGSYTGSVERDMFSDKFGTTSGSYQLVSKCQGIDELKKVM